MVGRPEQDPCRAADASTGSGDRRPGALCRNCPAQGLGSSGSRDPRSEAPLLGIALLVLKALICAVERVRPRRAFQHGLVNRWAGNGGMLAVDTLFVGLIFAPGAALGTAWYCEQNGVGVFQQTGAPLALAAVVGWLALDFAMWLQHWAQHRSSLLWRSHRVHHTDLDLDFSTSLRFHPFEAAWTTLARILTVGLLGVPVVVALVYEVSLNVVSTLSHSNLDIPERIDAWLRRVIVTGDVHRVHHSVAAERESNYGSVLTAWDRMLGTYVAQPEKGHRDMELGLPEHRDAASLHLPALLWMPFRENPGPAPPLAR